MLSFIENKIDENLKRSNIDVFIYLNIKIKSINVYIKKYY